MEETVIETIAQQLCLTVEQAKNFIVTNLPAYAEQQVLEATVPLIIGGACLLILLATVIPLFVYVCRNRGRYEEAISQYNETCEKALHRSYTSEERTQMNQLKEITSHYDSLVILLIGLTIVLIIVAIFIVFSLIDILPNLIGWQERPEAMLLQKIVNKIW